MQIDQKGLTALIMQKVIAYGTKKFLSHDADAELHEVEASITAALASQEGAQAGEVKQWRVSAWHGTPGHWEDGEPNDFQRQAYKIETRTLYTTPPAPDEAVRVAGSEVLAALIEWTFVVQHNPNCPSPWLVRLPAPGKSIDMLPYRNNQWIAPKEETRDILGFGKTFEEAASVALRARKGGAA